MLTLENDPWSADITARALTVANSLNGVAAEAQAMGVFEGIKDLVVTALMSTITINRDDLSEHTKQNLRLLGADMIEQAEQKIQALIFAIPAIWEAMALEMSEPEPSSSPPKLRCGNTR